VKNKDYQRLRTYYSLKKAREEFRALPPAKVEEGRERKEGD